MNRRYIVIMLYFALLCNFVVAQQRNYKCIYTTSRHVEGLNSLENEELKREVLKDFKADKKIFHLFFHNGEYSFKKTDMGNDFVGMAAGVLEVYINFDQGTAIYQEIIDGKKYIINDEVKKYKWIITKDTKDFSGRPCTKALLEDDRTITAWFSADIPFNFGPLGYYGLPGLIIRLDTPAFIYQLQEIVPIDEIEINPPSEGKKITRKECERLEKELEEKYIKAAKAGKTRTVLDN